MKDDGCRKRRKAADKTKSLWGAFTAKEKLCWHLHHAFNRICWMTDWKYERLKKCNDYFAHKWISKYLAWGKERREEINAEEASEK